MVRSAIEETTLSSADVEALRSGVRGAVLSAGDAGYDEGRRIWNGMIDKRPGAIARCTGAADILAAVRFARERDLLVAVRGGGHNVAGTAVCDGGLLIDLSAMRGVRVDPRARRAVVQGGALWGDVDHETEAFGLVTPAGIVSHTGVAGLTLGGGIGWLQRRYGLTSDNLVSADVVTGDGRFLKARADENADLFFGLRGGGGNFGIVSSFEFDLHALGPVVLAGPIIHHADRAADVLRFYRDFAAECPDELTTILILRYAPPAPWIPKELHGLPIVQIAAVYAGSVEDGERALAPLRSWGSPLLDAVAPRPYASHQAMYDGAVPHGLRYYWKSHYVAAMSDDVIDVLTARAWDAPTRRSYTIIFQLGGAIANRPHDDATSLGDRQARHAVNINGVGDDPAQDEAILRWTRDLFGALEPMATGGVYMNFLGNEGEDRVRAAYGPGVYERLVALKTKYDPTNFFRLNQNIRPDATRD